MGVLEFLTYKFNAVLVRTGEALGWEWLIYNPIVRRGFELGARKDGPIVVACVMEEFPHIKSAADCGCGMGHYSKEFMDRGVSVVACEYSEKNRERTKQHGVRCEPFDVGRSTAALPGGPFDVAISIEVAEHIPPALADRFAEFMTNQSGLLVISAAQPGQGGAGHLNEQPKSYWIEKFRSRGFAFDDAATQRLIGRYRERGAAWFLLNNAMVFRKIGAAG